ncbi:hypothetical protein BDR05DRAFT_971036, partial [Suillus weaverae]
VIVIAINSTLDFRHRTTPHHIRVHDQRGERREPDTVQLVSHRAEQQPHSTVP